jgi:RsiW-degrading membrane proteinase PrsW (M82 family)
MFYLYALTSIFVAWIWVDYFRLVDIYDRDSLKNLISAFFIGGLSVPLVFGAHMLFIDELGFGLNGGFWNDLLYCILQIGLLEELCKLLSFLLVWRIFRKQLNEPIDIIAYMSVCALGFAAIENTLYFNNYGSVIISGRAVLSTVAHMIFASLTAYGIIRWQFLKKSSKGWRELLFFFFLSAVVHGLYDFFLMHRNLQAVGYLITILFYLEGISVFAVIINNALNNSSFFTHKLVVDNEKVSLRILSYYILVFILQFILIAYESGISEAISSVGIATFLTATIVVIFSLRLSRFKLIPLRWEPLSLQIPFRFSSLDENDEKFFKISVRGEAYNEIYLSRFYQEYFWLCPIGKKHLKLDQPHLCFVEDKVFLKNDESYYLTKLFLDDQKQRWEYILLKPKLKGRKFTDNRSPIIAVLSKPDFSDLSNKSLALKDFSFISWAYPKSCKEWDKKRA